MPAPLDLPADLLPLHVAVVAADRAMTTAREQDGDVDQAREQYVAAALALRAHPVWEQARQAGAYHQTWQASLDAAKAALNQQAAASWPAGRSQTGHNPNTPPMHADTVPSPHPPHRGAHRVLPLPAARTAASGRETAGQPRLAHHPVHPDLRAVGSHRLAHRGNHGPQDRHHHRARRTPAAVRTSTRPRIPASTARADPAPRHQLGPTAPALTPGTTTGPGRYPGRHGIVRQDMTTPDSCGCPRCNGPLALFDGDIGASSRVTLGGGIRICGTCGSDESIRDAYGLPPIPPEDWPVPLDSITVWPTGGTTH